VIDKRRFALYVGLALLGLVSVFFTKIALFVLVGSFIAFLSVKPAKGAGVAMLAPDVRLLTGLTAFAGATSMVGFGRFLVVEAMPGIVQGGTTASGAAAVSRLREILFAEDVMRQKAFIDPDGDRVGSAALLGEMLGRTDMRGRERLVPPVLERYPELVETALGPAAEIAGYYFLVCLPAVGGGFTARPGEAVDDEAAERRFVAYAWPSQEGRGLLDSYFIDEHERILFAHASAPAGHRERLGPERPPACDDALAPASRERWQVWRGKRPRASLPGEKP
jgi:hypothetical protein